LKWFLKNRGVGVMFYDFFCNLDLFSYEKWCGLDVGLAFGLWWTTDDKNSSKFEHVVVVIHGSLLWMLGEEERLFEDLTDRSSRWRSDRYRQATRSGSAGDLSSGESKFLYKRNPK
jgi:hypothetical protein